VNSSRTFENLSLPKAQPLPGQFACFKPSKLRSPFFPWCDPRNGYCGDDATRSRCARTAHRSIACLAVKTAFDWPSA